MVQRRVLLERAEVGIAVIADVFYGGRQSDPGLDYGYGLPGAIMMASGDRAEMCGT